jgi:hypothetical protein
MAEHGDTQRIILAGRLNRREKGVVSIELTDGVTIDVMEADCKSINEVTDPVSLRAVVTIELKGDNPITATFQPHFYRVLSSSRALPFVFHTAGGMTPKSLATALLSNDGNGNGGYDHDTTLLTNTWFGTERDGTKPDDASEPGEEVLN